MWNTELLIQRGLLVQHRQYKRINNFKKGDVYLTGNDVVVNDIIDGNLFVFANSVTINSQIGGDAFILAGTVNVGEQGYIFSNLFTCAQNVNISGVVYDLYTTASQRKKADWHIYVINEYRACPGREGLANQSDHSETQTNARKVKSAVRGTVRSRR